MTTYTYPAGDFDRWRSLMGTLGSFWNELFEDRAQLRSLAEGRVQLGAQTLLELMDLFDAMSRYRIPILHRQNWYVLYLRESECNSVPAVLPGYGDGDIYGGPRIYGQAATTQYAFPAPADLAEAYILVNRFTDPRPYGTAMSIFDSIPSAIRSASVKTPYQSVYTKTISMTAVSGSTAKQRSGSSVGS